MWATRYAGGRGGLYLRTHRGSRIVPVRGCLLTPKCSMYNGYMAMHVKTSKSCSGLIPPWSARSQWREANKAIAAALGSRTRRFGIFGDLAQQIRRRVDLLDPMLDALCADTCCGCIDKCCERATVWYDFKDLLVFHLGGAPVPAAQLAPVRERSCRFLDASGCGLPRRERPFICTWFICPDQRQVLEGWLPSRRQFIENSLAALKDGRNRLEKTFMQRVVGT